MPPVATPVRPTQDVSRRLSTQDVDSDAEASWVDAAPFRALLRQLIDDTGLPAPVLAAAIGLPGRTAWSLVSATRPTRRIRWVDAKALLDRDYAQLRAEARTCGDASRLHSLLATTCPDLTAAQLARLLRTDTWTAGGLLDGWLTSCPHEVIWRALALIEGWTTTSDMLRADAELG